MQEIATKANMDILTDLGISPEVFQLACNSNPELQMHMPQMPQLVKFRELSESEMREGLRFQKVYLENHGQDIVDKMKQET